MSVADFCRQLHTARLGKHDKGGNSPDAQPVGGPGAGGRTGSEPARRGG